LDLNSPIRNKNIVALFTLIYKIHEQTISLQTQISFGVL